MLFLLNTVLKILAKAIRQENKIRGIQTEKEEIHLPLLTENMIVYAEKKNYPEKLLEPISDYSPSLYRPAMHN